MTSQMTERFSAPGATLVKLFGRPAARRPPSSAHGRERVNDIGVRSAMAMEMFFTIARPRVRARRGADLRTRRLPGPARASSTPARSSRWRCCSTGCTAPLTALATARLDVVTALVSFERVFEVLDVEPLIREAPDARSVPDGPVAVELDDVHFAYPTAEQVSLASLEEVTVLDDRPSEEVLHGVSAARRRRATPWPWSARRAPASRRWPRSCPRLYDVDAGAVRLGGVDVRDLSFDSIRATVGVVTPGRPPVPRHDPAPTCATPHPTPTTTSCGRRSSRRGWRRLVRCAARRPRHRGRRARLPAVRR